VAGANRIGKRRRSQAAIVKTGKEEGFDDVLTPGEAKQVREGEAQLRQGLYVTLEQLERNLERKARKPSRKAV